MTALAAAEATRTVLVALDGSPAAAAAMPTARSLASQLSVPLSVLHIAPAWMPLRVVRKRLHLDAPLLGGADVHVHQGTAADGILHMIEQPGTLLTVLTTHGRAIEPGRHLGHTAEAVIARTTRPILLIRPEVARPVQMRRLLVPFDGSPTTARGLAAVWELAYILDAEIHLLFVVGADWPAAAEEPGAIGVPYYVDQPQHEWPAWSREVVDRLAAYDDGQPVSVPINVYIAPGDIDSEIVKFATEHEVHVVVLVRRSKLEPGRARTLRAVLDRTPCPVLLVGAPPSR